MSKLLFICFDHLTGLDYEVIQLPPSAGHSQGDVIDTTGFHGLYLDDDLHSHFDDLPDLETIH